MGIFRRNKVRGKGCFATAMEKFTKEVLDVKKEIAYTEEDWAKVKKMEIFSVELGAYDQFKFIKIGTVDEKGFIVAKSLSTGKKYVFGIRFECEAYCFVTKINGEELDGYIQLSDENTYKDLIDQI